MFTFYRFKWSLFVEDLEVDTGTGVYYINRGLSPNEEDMKHIIARSLNVSADGITINSYKQISQAEYETVTKKPFIA
jgi:hypothetical protein